MIYIFSGKELESIPFLYDKIFRLRKKVFKDFLNWDVDTHADYEIDQYDRRDAMYALNLVDGNLACMYRMLPTTKPYMMDGPFKSLMPEDLIPHSEDTWELSRFCMDHDLIKSQDHRLHLATELAIGIGEYCLLKGIREIISVQSPEITTLANQAYGLPRYITPPKKFGIAYASVTIYCPNWQTLLFNGREANLLPSPVLARVPEQMDYLPSKIEKKGSYEELMSQIKAARALHIEPANKEVSKVF